MMPPVMTLVSRFPCAKVAGPAAACPAQGYTFFAECEDEYGNYLAMVLRLFQTVRPER